MTDKAEHDRQDRVEKLRDRQRIQAEEQQQKQRWAESDKKDKK